jgi:hypothetical protein
MTKLIAINIVTCLAIVATVILTPSLAWHTKQVITDVYFHDSRSSLVNYEGIPWAADHFVELRQQRTVYFDFFGWRRAQFEGHTITVSDLGYRLNGDVHPEDAEVLFFGGSAIWGEGVDDRNTIPALFQAITGIRSFNLGEGAWVAQQSVNLLQKVIIQGARPRRIVFYDGVNEILHHCRADTDFFATAQQVQLRRRLSARSPYSLRTVFSAAITAVESMQKAATEHSEYDCDQDVEKAQRVAVGLVASWIAARNLSESVGAEFLPILQPVAYMGNPRLDHLSTLLPWENKETESVLGRQYLVVYPIMKRALSEHDVKYLDLTQVLDRDSNNSDPLYIDFAHLSPKGNALIARKITEALWQEEH